jgi:hypothetical protein
MRRKGLAGLLVSCLFAFAPLANAAPFELTFQMQSQVPPSLGGGTWSLDVLPSTRYRVLVDFERAGSFTPVGQSPDETFRDGPSNRFFWAGMVDNYFESPNAPPSGRSSYGSLTQGVRENQWGSGNTYQTYRYESRMDIVVGESLDQVYFWGGWSTAIQLLSPHDLMQPGAVWIVADYMGDENGSRHVPSWFATLVSVEPVAQVSEPHSGSMALLALGFALVLRRSNANRARS